MNVAIRPSDWKPLPRLALRDRKAWGSGAPATINGGLTNLNANSVAVRSTGHLKSIIRSWNLALRENLSMLAFLANHFLPESRNFRILKHKFSKRRAQAQAVQPPHGLISVSILKTLLWANHFGCPICKARSSQAYLIQSSGRTVFVQLRPASFFCDVRQNCWRSR